MTVLNKVSVQQAIEADYPYYLLQIENWGNIAFPTPPGAQQNIGFRNLALAGLAIGPNSDFASCVVANRFLYGQEYVPIGPDKYVVATQTEQDSFSITRENPVGPVDSHTLVGKTVSEQGTKGFFGPRQPTAEINFYADFLTSYPDVYESLGGAFLPFTTDPAFVPPLFELALYLQPPLDLPKKRSRKTYVRSTVAAVIGTEIPVAMVCIDGRKDLGVEVDFSGTGDTTIRATVLQSYFEIDEVIASTTFTATAAPFFQDLSVQNKQWLIVYAKREAGSSVGTFRTTVVASD